ncbi:MAG: hypothetical protein KZQ80_04175 [Candidatus Thiodiazotropha sp. (ex Monitilora ramsayi)]|nr:hypothetical protein [Candidatus Thiodiazotropha sp. (ex Monitilora ramsayi)]
MKRFTVKLIMTGVAAGLTLLTGGLAAHDLDEAGMHVCIEGNYMMANAMNAPFADANGPGQVIEMNIFTGTPGLTVNNPFNALNAGTDICPDDFDCPGPWKPTGVLSGGLNGHAFITSAGQQGLTELHRDGTPIRTVSYKSLMDNPDGPEGYGTVPRPLGSQMMPNGNIIQAVCDANFFNASNSDRSADAATGLEADMYFPPVSSTDQRAGNSRLLVIDQQTLEVIDEYSRPARGKPGHDLWGCFAGIMFDDRGMYVSTFHGGAVLVIDWMAGVDKQSRGVGSNGNKRLRQEDREDFELDKRRNRAKVIDVIDFRLGRDDDDPSRRDSLRAISFDESGNIYATDRQRSRDCLRGEIPGTPSGCNPGVFRQRVNIASFDGYNDADLRRSVALDPGVNVIAGIRTNRMSGPGCEYVKDNADLFATEYNFYGYEIEEDLCDVETVLVAASAMNPGEIHNPGGCVGGNPANACFKPGGGVVEYLTHPNWTDGGPGWGGAGCSGDPSDPAGNLGCARPIASFPYRNPDNGPEIGVDPRMLMVIHEAFVQ